MFFKIKFIGIIPVFEKRSPSIIVNIHVIIVVVVIIAVVVVVIAVAVKVGHQVGHGVGCYQHEAHVADGREGAAVVHRPRAGVPSLEIHGQLSLTCPQQDNCRPILT